MNPTDEEERVLDQNALRQAYSECVNAIKSLRDQIKQYQQQRNSTDPNVLSNYLKSDKAYYPSANKERNGSARFQCRSTFKGHFNKIHNIAWSNNGYIASCGQDQKLIIWSGSDNHAGSKICVIDLPDLSAMALNFSCKNGEYVACGGLDNQCTIYQINYNNNNNNVDDEKSNYTKLNVLRKHSGFISDCILMHDATELMTCSGDGKIYLWDIENGLPTQEFIGHESDVMQIRECNIEYFQQFGDNKVNNKLLLSASTDGTCKLWDYRLNKANNCVFTYYLHKNDVNCCSWFPDGNAFASGSEDGTIKLIDIRTHRQLNVYKTKGGALNSVQSICFSKSGYFLFAGMEC